MPVTDSTVAKFWAWFAANAGRIRAVPPEDLGRSKEYGELSAQIEKVHKRVKCEMETAGGDDAEWTLVLSADGEERLFPFVETIVAGAPASIPGWRVRKFRSRSPVEGISLQFGPHKLSAEDVYVQAAPVGGRLGLTLYVRGLTPENGGLLRAVDILLDHTIGEYDGVKTVTHVGRFPLPDPPPAGAVPLGELPALMDRFKAGG